MDPQFWHDKWAAGEIGFHNAEANPLLVAHLEALAVPPGGRVFVPLCGKTLDIGWLLSKGHTVAGAELSERAVVQLFEELKTVPTVTGRGTLRHYAAPGIDIFAGDIFDLSAAILGPVDAVYDRAALVALPEDMRIRYTRHLTALTGTARQLLVTFEYDPSQMTGPPFSIPPAEVRRHYGTSYRIAPPLSAPMAEGLKGIDAVQTVWHLF